LKKQKDRLKRAAKKTPLLMSACRRGRQGSAAGAAGGDRRGPVSIKAKGAAQAEPWSPQTA